MKIILRGSIGSNKGAIASKLADMLDVESIEISDLVLAKSERKSIKEIFEKDGEKCFRKLEAQVASELSNREDVIITSGEDVVIDEKSLNVLGGVSIYLKTDSREIDEKLYEKNSDHVITTDNKKVDNIAQEIIKKLFFMCEGGGCKNCSSCN